MLLHNPRTHAIIQVDNEERRQRRLVRRLRHWWRALDGNVDRAWMVTLTYREDGAWRPEHVTDFIRLVRADGGMKAYAWVAEVQPGTGRVHYHILIVGSRPAWVERRWGKGFTQVKAAWSVGYLLKYLWKGDTSGLPKGARRFAVWVASGLLCSAADFVLQLGKLPAWVGVVCERLGELATYQGRGVWVTDYLGVVLASEWRVL